ALQVGGLGWPASGALLAGFGATMPDGRSSDGLLIGAGAGSPVKAVADGQVVYAEWMTGYGLLLIVDHGNGYMSLYAHNDALLKDVGATVRRGESLGTVGSSGGQGRPALYFELRRNGAPVNPSTWLRH
ncbi:MAG: murein hydrolase activator EnvC family protein, partial [Lysobacter sp.]